VFFGKKAKGGGRRPHGRAGGKGGWPGGGGAPSGGGGRRPPPLLRRSGNRALSPAFSWSFRSKRERERKKERAQENIFKERGKRGRESKGERERGERRACWKLEGKISGVASAAMKASPAAAAAAASGSLTAAKGGILAFWLALAFYSDCVASTATPGPGGWWKPADRSRYEIVPEDTIAFLGSRVLLKCRTTRPEKRVQWTQNSFGLGFDRELREWSKRFRMIGQDGRE